MCPSGRMLLVEDDPTMQAIVSGILTGAGYEDPCIACDAEAALTSLESCDPCLVLMDITLSGEVDGIEAAEKIRGIRDVPIVFLSGASHREMHGRIEESGAYGFVAKPFEPEQLLAAIDTALGRHRLDRDLRRNRRLLSGVLENIDEGILSVDLEGRLVYVNRAGAELLDGPQPGADISGLLQEQFPDDGATIVDFFDQVFCGDQDALGEVLTLRDPQKGHLNIRCQPMMEGGEQRGFVMVVRDLTEESRLLQELQSFRSAVDTMQIGVTITDLERNILYVNEAEAAMHGFEVDELLGRNARILGRKAGEKSEDNWPERPARWSRETRNLRKDGGTFPVQLYSDVLRDVRGRASGLITCCRDLSAQKAAEAEIRKLSQVVEQSPTLVVMTDIEGDIEYINPRFEEVTGYSLEEALGANPRILRTEDNAPELYEDLWATITEGRTWVGEFHNRKKDGSTYWALASISGIRGEDGRIAHYVGVQVDISKRKELEKELEAKNADLERLNQLKGEMMAITSHDLKSPLNGMISVATMIRDLGERLPPEKLRKYNDMIIAEGQKLRNFISGILDAERLDSGGLGLEKEETTLEEILENCLRNARLEARPKEISVEMEAEGKGRIFHLDPARMTQVFQNLLSNAIKFSPNGSRIGVELKSEDSGSVVRICDEGPGIPPDELEKIFDRYYQVKSGAATAQRVFGSGLGLYVSREIVEMHGGKIHVENREGAGCCFVVVIPADTGDREDG